MEKLTVTSLKKQLEQKSKQELIQDITELYKKFSDVKEYYQVQDGNIELISEKYKEIIKKEFVNGYTRGLPKARLSVARKAVQDFKKFTSNPELLADMMFTFVELISSFNKEFGVDSESYYTSPENMFDNVLDLLKKNNLLSKFEKRAFRIVNNATEAWGHFDSLQESYEQFYGEYEH